MAEGKARDPRPAASAADRSVAPAGEPPMSGAPTPDGPAPAPTGESPVSNPADRSPLRARPLGPEDLKAFTHPLRMAMYTALRDQGPATASQLARRLGESSGQTSYHLRQLERHGFVEDDPEHTGGRERWWRPIGFSVDDRTLLEDPSSALAVRTMLDEDVTERGRVLRRFAEALLTGDVPMDEAATVLDTLTAELTRDEAAALIVAVQELLNAHIDAAKARRVAGDTEGRRRTRIYFDVVPLATGPADES